MTVNGIDVSHLQGLVDWPMVVAAGNAFAFAKVSEGTGFHDPTFAINWKGAKAAGLLVGAYHFFHLEQDAATQAQTFLAAIAKVNGGSPVLGPGYLPCVIDVEPRFGVNVPSPQDIAAGVRIWLTTVSQATGVPAMVYCSPGWWNGAVAPAMPLPGCLFWLAEYEEGLTAPSLPKGVLDWTFWQNSGSARVSGVDANVDTDVFNGAKSDLAALARLSP
jgi:lysozyme